MPDTNGNFKGTGWTRSYDAAWDRVFGGHDLTNFSSVMGAVDFAPFVLPCSNDNDMCCRLGCMTSGKRR